MCLIFEGSSLAFVASYQSLLRVYWFLHKGVPYFGYPSEQLNNPTDINAYASRLTVAAPYVNNVEKKISVSVSPPNTAEQERESDRFTDTSGAHWEHLVHEHRKFRLR